MKKVIIIVGSFLFISCNSNKCITTYLKGDIYRNKEKKIPCVLFDEKTPVREILRIYSDPEVGIDDSIHASKTFNQSDFKFLKQHYKNDTIREYWSNADARKFSFEKLTTENDSKATFTNLRKNKSNWKVYEYIVSKPLFFKNKKTALFGIHICLEVSSSVEDCVIIMKKEKGEWVFVEKVYNQRIP